jgi:hypothetical protein
LQQKNPYSCNITSTLPRIKLTIAAASFTEQERVKRLVCGKRERVSEKQENEKSREMI